MVSIGCLQPQQRSDLEIGGGRLELAHVASVPQVPLGVRREIADMLGNEAALHGDARFARQNGYAAALDEPLDPLRLDEA